MVTIKSKSSCTIAISVTRAKNDSGEIRHSRKQFHVIIIFVLKKLHVDGASGYVKIIFQILQILLF